MRIAEYLLTHYYAHTNRLDLIPTKEQINQAILNHPEKIVVIRRGQIRGIAFFLTLTDETYNRLETLDITKIPMIQALALENGRNFHFVVLAADGYRTIKLGLRKIMKLNPKTISWWNPSFTKLHRYGVK